MILGSVFRGKQKRVRRIIGRRKELGATYAKARIYAQVGLTGFFLTTAFFFVAVTFFLGFPFAFVAVFFAAGFLAAVLLAPVAVDFLPDAAAFDFFAISGNARTGEPVRNVRPLRRVWDWIDGIKTPTRAMVRDTVGRRATSRWVISENIVADSGLDERCVEVQTLVEGFTVQVLGGVWRVAMNHILAVLNMESEQPITGRSQNI